MRKRSKIISVFLSAAIMMSALCVPAAAVDDAELSPYAGKVLRVQVCNMSTNTTTYVEVDIPEDATVKEQQDLVTEAAMSVSFPQARSYDPVEIVGSVRIKNVLDVSLYPAVPGVMGGTYITEFTLNRNYRHLVMQYYDVTAWGNTKWINVRFENNSYPNDQNFYTTWNLGNVNVDTEEKYVEEALVMVTDGTLCGNVVLHLEAGNTIEVYGSTDQGHTYGDVVFSGIP